MRTRVEYSGSIDAPGWTRRHERGEVPDALPYGFDRLTALGHELVVAPSLRGPRVGRVARAVRTLAGGVEVVESLRRVDRGPVDVVLCQDERAGLPALLRESLRPGGRPVVTGSVWLADALGVSRTQAGLARRVLPRAGAVWTYSDADADALVERYAVRRQVVHTLDFGIDPDFYLPVEGGPEPGGGDDHPPLVVSAGNDRHRDFPLLARALARLRGDGVPLTAVVASSQWVRPVTAPPWFTVAALDNVGVRALYRRASVVVVPTVHNLHVSGVTVVLEAMAVGVPVVVSGTPGFGRYVRHEETGLVVPPGDVDALAAAVRRVLTDPTGARERAVRARAAVLSTFTTQHLADQLDVVLRAAA